MDRLSTIAIASYIASPLVILALQTTHVGDYNVTQAIGSTSVAPKNGGYTLMDSNNDGTVDTKYRSCFTRRGSCSYDLPITLTDQQIFDDISSRL